MLPVWPVINGSARLVDLVAARQTVINVAFIDQSLGEAGGAFPLGSQLSTADLYLHMLAGWGPAIYVLVLTVFAQPAEISAQQFPNVKRSSVAMLKHSAIARTFAASHY